MGFCAILGGTMTMVASSPLIMLNDLIENANRGLDADQAMQPFGLFSVTPVGVALVAAGLIFFLVFGRSMLPKGTTDDMTHGTGTARYMRRLHGVNAAVREVPVPFEQRQVLPARVTYQHVSRFDRCGGNLVRDRAAATNDRNQAEAVGQPKVQVFCSLSIGRMMSVNMIMPMESEKNPSASAR